MQSQATGPLGQLSQQLSDYLPTLAAGLVVLAVGAVTGWLVKRAVVRVLMLLRLDRLGGGRSAWSAAIGKGDVRDALYNVAGTAVGLALVLVFLDNALQIWGLTVLSRMIDQTIFYLPTLALAVIIVGLGIAMANLLAERVETALAREDIPRAGLIAGLAKSSLLAVVGALALWELNFGREIVLAAFLIGFGAIGVAFALAVGIGSTAAIREWWGLVLKRRSEADSIDGGS